MADRVSVVNKWSDGTDTDRQAIGQALGMPFRGVGARASSGVIPGGSNPLGLSFSGLNSTVKAGRYLLSPSDASLGPVWLVLPNDVVLTHDNASSSNPRKDLIIAEAADLGSSSSFGRIRIVKGRTDVTGAPTPTTNWDTATPGSASPGVSLGNGSWESLWSVSIPASGGAGSISSATDLRKWAVAAGGVDRNANRTWQAVRDISGTWSADTMGYHIGVTVPANEALPGIYILEADIECLLSGTLDAGTAIFHQYLDVPEGVREVGYNQSYGRFDHHSWFARYIHTGSGIALPWTARGVVTGQHCKCLGANDASNPTRMTVTRIVDY